MLAATRTPEGTTKFRKPRNQDEEEFFTRGVKLPDTKLSDILIANVLGSEDVQGRRVPLDAVLLGRGLEEEGSLNREEIQLNRVEHDNGVVVELVLKPDFLKGVEFDSLRFHCFTSNQKGEWDYGTPYEEYDPMSTACLLRHGEYWRRKQAGNLTTEAGSLDNLPPIRFYFHDGALDNPECEPFNAIRIDGLSSGNPTVFGIYLDRPQGGTIAESDDGIFSVKYVENNDLLYAQMFKTQTI